MKCKNLLSPGVSSKKILKNRRCRYISENYFLSLFILLTRRKVSVTLYFRYIPTYFRRCQDIVVRLKFLFDFLIFSFIDTTEIWNYLLRLQAEESIVKCFFQGHNKLTRVGFEQRPCWSRSLSM